MPEVAVAEVQRFMEDCLRSVGTPDEEARKHAALLLYADVTGHFSHGLNRLEFYINDILAGATTPAAKPEVLKESAATAWVHGHGALGATVADFCMDLAVRKARECGIGWVTAKGTNHFGMAGYWALKAEREGLIGLAFTNSSPIMVPTRAKQGALGTNPIGMAAPATEGDSLVIDMASTAVAMGKIEVQIHKGQSLPDGWALGPDGKPTNDAKLAFDAGRLLPLGGFEETSGYKGYGLSAMVEVFCSGLSGSNASHQVKSWTFDTARIPSNLGQCFAAIDPGHFAPGFAERMAECLKMYRGLEPMDPSLPVLAPGDKERLHQSKTKACGYIQYSQGQLDACRALAERLAVKELS